MSKKHGLRERIKEATTEKEVNALLASGKKFEFVSDRTCQSWKNTAQRRLKELASEAKQ